MANVQLQTTYRISDAPPELCSLAPGELFVELDTASGVPPRLWVGTEPVHGYSGNVALILSATPTPAPSSLTIHPIDNPSTGNMVAISGVANPGCMVEVAILQGTNIDFFLQLADWVPIDASGGTFSHMVWVPSADWCRVRCRMHDDPQTWVDSNLFAVTA